MAKKKPTIAAPPARTAAQKKSPARKAARARPPPNPPRENQFKSRIASQRSQDRRAPAPAKRPRAEAAHRHQPLPRRGFQGRRPAHLRALPRSRHCRRQPRPGAGACDPADRAVQSGGSFKTAFPRRRVPDGLCAQGLGQDLHGRAGRNPDASKAAPGPSRRESSI